MNKLTTAALQLYRNIGGNISMIAAITAIPMVGAAGAAIDYVRWSSAKTEAIAAIDGAVLAGTRALMENGGKKQAALAVSQSYFAKNFPSASELADNSIAFNLNAAGTGIVASGNAIVKTSFLQVLDIDGLLLFPESGAKGEAQAGSSSPGSDLEISLMLDVTGSMCNDGEGPCTSSPKLDALKAAAKLLVDKVVWADQSEYTSRVAIVPFSTRVRVEQDAASGSTMNKLTGLQPTWSGWYRMCTASTGGGGSEGGGNWTCTRYTTSYYNNWKILPCVTDRFYDSGWRFDLTDTEPKNGFLLNGHDGTRMTEGRDSSNTRATTATGNRNNNPATHWNFDSAGNCYDVPNSNQILPLTNDTTALKSRINGLEAYGSTAGVLGTAFSWYMLSPEWKNVWTGQSQPKSYSLLTDTNSAGKPKLRKIAILMTDGVYNTFRGWKDQDKSWLSTNAIAMCNAMKAKGIEVYTIGFALDALDSADKTIATNTLQSCGSSIEHFYNSLDVSQLTAAFESIGNKVNESSVRLTY